MRLTSAHNPVIKHVRSLATVKGRREHRAYTVEGVRLVAEAMRSPVHSSVVLYVPDLLGRTPAGVDLIDHLAGWADNVYEVDERLLRQVSDTEAPAGIVAVLVGPSARPVAPEMVKTGLVIDGVADPGNVGSMLRTACAVGVDVVLSTPNTADFYSPKVMRAGMGAHFRVSLHQYVSWGEIAEEFTQEVIGMASNTGDSIYRFSWPERFLLVCGSEARGLSEPALDTVRRFVHVPMKGGTESLNVSVATAITLYTALGGKI